MIKQFETTLFFATTVGALALAAVLGVQEFSAGPSVQQAVAMPMVQLEAVQIIGHRGAQTAVQQAPEQIALVR
ncbi:MAG: hypothetical protein ABJA83_13945 [Burkholderiaceae bacterium]